MNDLKNSIANATKWSALAEVAAKLILPIVNMILARLLTPSAFGVVSTVNIVITFAEIFQDAGFQKYIVQHNFKNYESFEKNANVAFWTNFSLSIVIFLVIVAFRYDIAIIIGSRALYNEVVIASISIPIYSICSIQTAYYRRNFEYKKLFTVRIITSLIPLFVTVPLAMVCHNHWALIIGTIVRNIAQAITLYFGAKWKPSFYYSFKLLRKMLSFCMWTLFESITIWCSTNISIFIITRVLGVETVGLFRTSITTVTSITSIVTAATTSVLFSALSRVQNDDKALNDLFYGYQQIVSLVVIPMGIGIFLYRELVTRILLGSQWLQCADFIGAYAVVMSFTIITSYFFSELYRAKGKPRISMIAQLFYLLFSIPAIYFSSRYGFNALCVASILSLIWFMFVHFVIVSQYFSLNLKVVICNISLVLIPSCVMCIVAYILQTVFSGVLWQFVSILICIVVYFTIVLAFRPLRNVVKENDLTASLYKRIRLKFHGTNSI